MQDQIQEIGSPPLLLRLEQVAERLQCSRPLVSKLIAEGKLPSVKLSDEKYGARRVLPADLEAFIEARRVASVGQ